MMRKLSVIIVSMALGLSVGSSQFGCFGTGGVTFEVLGVTPDASAINVLVNSTIKVTFNQALIESSVNADTVYVTDANGNRVDGAFSFDSWISLVFTPTNPLAEGMVYTATVTTGVKALLKDEELSLDENYVWSFTTQKWFAVGGMINSSEAAGVDPVMMIMNDPPSTVIKADALTYTPGVGYRYEDTKMHLQFWSGTEWSTTIADPTNARAYTSNHTPSFCTDGEFVNMATGLSTDPESVFGYQWEPTTNWQGLNGGTEISNAGGNSASEAVVACRPSGGNPFVAWLESAPSSDTVEVYVASVSLAGINRSGPLSRNDQSGDWYTDAEAVGIAADDTNAYLAHWEHNHVEQSQSDLYVTMWDGAGFTNLGDIVASNLSEDVDVRMPSVLVNNGTVYVAYALADADGNRYINVQSWDGASWNAVGGPFSALVEDVAEANNPDIAMAGDTLYVAWEEDTSGVYAAYFNGSSGEWVLNDLNRTVNQVLDGAPSSASDPTLAYSSTDDMIYMALEASGGGNDGVFVIRRSR